MEIGCFLCGGGGLVSGTLGDALGGHVFLMRLYSLALRLLNVVDFLACFYGIGGKISASSVEPGAW